MSVDVAIPTFDDMDKEPPLPEPVITVDPVNSTKTIIEHYYDDMTCDLVKSTKVYRHERRQVTAAIARRRTWKKYGAAAPDPPGPNTSTTFPVREEVNLQYIQRQQSNDQDKVDEEAAVPKSKSNLVCRVCKGAHFSHQCPNKSDMEAIKDLQSKLRGTMGEAENTESTNLPGQPEFGAFGSGTGNRYVPPQMRATGMVKRGMEGYTVRVTNLPSDMQVEDLKAIFEAYGPVTRIYPAKDKVTQLNRGFAFISYATYDSAQQAVALANGKRSNHVVLKVDWARPSNQT